MAKKIPKAAKDKQKATKKGKKGPKIVPKHMYFGKNLLAPYINEDGCPFYVGKNKDEKETLKLKQIRKDRNSSNEEMCRRMGMGLALDAANLHGGAACLAKHCSGDWAVFGQDRLAASEGFLPRRRRLLGR